MASYDLFWAAQGRNLTHSTFSVALGANVTIAAGRNTVTLASAPQATVYPGQTALLRDNDGTRTAYMRVLAVPTSTTLEVEWLRRTTGADAQGVDPTSVDPTGLVYTAAGSKVEATGDAYIEAATLVIDLSDAPEDSYNYAIVGQGYLTSTTANTRVRCRLIAGALVGDPYSGTKHGRLETTLANTAGNYTDTVNYTGSAIVSLTAGQRYEFHLQFSSSSSTGRYTSMTRPRLLALRYDAATSYVAGDGKTAEASTTSGTFTDYLALAPPAGTYLMLATWSGRKGAVGGVNIHTEFRVFNDVNGEYFALARSKPLDANDYMTGGVFRTVTLAATGDLALRYANTGAGSSSYIRDATLAMIRPRAFDTYSLATVGVAVYDPTANANWATGATSPSTTLTAGQYIEAISLDVVGNVPFSIRPEWSQPGLFNPTARGLHGQAVGTLGGDGQSTFFLERLTRTAAATTNAIGAKVADGNTAISLVRVAFSFLREAPTSAPLPDAAISLVADVETGLFVRGFDPIAGAYRKRLPDVASVSRVCVNAVDLKSVASFAALVNDSFFWDAAAHEVWVKLTGNADPGTQEKVTVVVEPLRIARWHEDLLDASGAALPYDARMGASPAISEELTSSNGRYGAATSLGVVEIIAPDGVLDDMLIQRQWEGLRTRIRRSVGNTSAELADMTTLAHAVSGMPSLSQAGVSLRMFDAGLLLMRPLVGIAETDSIAIESGPPDGYTVHQDKELPVVYGRVKRLPAYRTTHATAANATNSFQFAPAQATCKAVLAVYLEPDATEATAAGNVTDAAVIGGVAVLNSAWTPAGETYEAGQVGDTVFVDIDGRYDYTTSHYPTTPGAIARHLLTVHGGLTAKALCEPSFRLLDRTWRQQRSQTAILPLAPELGFIFEPSTTVAQALTTVCEESFAYWRVDAEGRIALEVPDLDVGTLVDNGGFETSATSIYPWRTASNATATLTSSRTFDGVRACEISNGGSPVAYAAIEQDIIIPRPGQVAVTLVASQLSGTTGTFRISLYSPCDEEYLSDPFTLDSSAWTRVTHVFDVASGCAGLATVRIYPAYGQTYASTVCVDNVEVFQVAAVLDKNNSVLGAVELDPESYYQAAVTYDVNLQDDYPATRARITDVEAKFLTGAVSEAQYVVASSGRVDLDTALARDASSALAIAAPMALHYGRQRHSMSIQALGLERIPTIGERIVHRDYRRIPETHDAYSIWRIVGVDGGEGAAQTVSLTVQRQSDPVIDRMSIASETVPVGAIGVTLGAGAITGFSELTAMQGYYAVAHAIPDIGQVFGTATHTHDLAHSHTVSSHQHAVTPVGMTEAVAGPTNSSGWPKSWLVSVTGHFTGDHPFGPNPPDWTQRNLTLKAHTHPLPAAVTVAATSTASAAGTITSASEPNDVDHVRVRFMQASGALAATIPQTLVVGYESATIPAGWVRVTALDSRALRGATATAGETVGTVTTVSAHSHGGAIAAHTHLAGHDHDASPSVNVAGETGQTELCWSDSNVNWAFDPRQPFSSAHGHAYRASLEGDSTASGSAAGSISAVKMACPQAGIVWMQPSDAAQTYIPAGALMLWSATGEPPSGWEFLALYDALILGGASAGLGATASNAGHVHGLTPAAHTYSHSHGGTETDATSGGNESYGVLGPAIEGQVYPWTPQFPTGATTTLASYRARNPPAGAYETQTDGHAHDVTATVATTAATLAAASSDSASSGSAKPPHRRLRVIRKK